MQPHINIAFHSFLLSFFYFILSFFQREPRHRTPTRSLQSPPTVQGIQKEIGGRRLRLCISLHHRRQEALLLHRSQPLTTPCSILQSPLFRECEGQFRLQRRLISTEQKKKRMKADPDVPRLSPSLRNHLEHLASLSYMECSFVAIIGAAFGYTTMTSAAKFTFCFNFEALILPIEASIRQEQFAESIAGRAAKAQMQAAAKQA
ncbi:hypothetical protein LXL04_020972 [Taraxacum kok-saghyz]